MMRILHFHRSLWAGGIEAMVCNLASEMARRGEDVTVGTIFKPSGSDLFFRLLPPSVKTVDLGKTDDKVKPFKEIFRVYTLIRDGHYDVVHLHGYFYYYIFAILMLHSRVRFFYTLHNDAYREGPPWDIRLLKFKRLFFRKGWMRAVTISEASKASFEELYGCPSVLIPNGIAMPEVTPSGEFISRNRITPSTRVFVNAGRVHEQKNQLMLCRVFDRLIREGEDVMLYIAGCIQDRSIFEGMRPFLSERIVFLDQRDDVPSLLSRADAMCLSSIFEGLPVVLLESLAVGCVPICTPVGGIVNVLHDGVDGILSAGTEEEEYLCAVRRFLSMDGDAVNALKAGARRLFCEYGIEAAALKYLDVYRTA